jgi:predicted amino acid racemase
MKKFILETVLIGLVIFIGCGVIGYSQTNYTRKDCIVIEVDCIEVTAKDKSGHIWTFLTDCGDYSVGDVVTLEMYNNHTDGNITDDIVKGVSK